MRSTECIPPAAVLQGPAAGVLEFREARSGSREPESGRGAGRGQLFPAAVRATPSQQRCEESGRRGRGREGGTGKEGGTEGGRSSRAKHPSGRNPREARAGMRGVPRAALLLFLLAFWHKTGTVGDYLGNPKSGMTQ